MPNQSPKKERSKKRKSSREQAQSYLKYSGMAFEMIIIMGLFTYGGVKLDEYFQTPENYFTVAGAILGTIFALAFVLKDFIINKKE